MESLEKVLKDLRDAYEEIIRLYKVSEEIGLASSVEAIKDLLLKYVDRLTPSIRDKHLILDFNNVPQELRDTWKRWEEEGIIDWIKTREKTTIVPEDDIIYVLTPLKVRNKIIGILIISSLVCPEELNQQVLNLLDTIAHQSAIGIENIRLHKEIEDMKNFLEELFNELPHGLLVTETNGRIRILNEKLLEILNITDRNRTSLLGKYIEEVFSSILSLKLREMISQTLLSGNLLEEEFTHEAGEKTIPLGISSNLFKENDLIEVIFIIRDLSESKELERLRRLDKLKSEFIASVSHELKTPLTAIKGFIELILDSYKDVGDENLNAILNLINEEIENLTKLINELLDFSRLEANKFHLEVSEFSIDEVIEKAVSIFERETEEKGITIYKEIDENIPKIKGDKGKILHVLINLIDNAIKYIGNGKKIWIKAWPDEGKGINVYVKDEGIGIPKESLPYIFDKFYRVENDYMHKVRGLGLGLSIAKQIIEAHGGKIWVESEVEKGSTFFLYIPTQGG